jgi:predicted protein tyrosine phosphatase
MQPIHKEHICRHLECPPDKVRILDIEDRYDRDDPELINELQRKAAPILDEWASANENKTRLKTLD